MTREKWADTLTGICILYMIAMHVSIEKSIGLPPYVPLYIGPGMFFFMGWFFYKSGMYFKPKPTLELCKKDSRRLLLPYVVFGMFGWAVNRFLHNDVSLLDDIASTVYSAVMTRGKRKRTLVVYTSAIYCEAIS